MARDEYGEDIIKSTVELGKANKKNIPLVKNWCKHIKIIDKSAGMIAEIYNLPTNQTICCPHTVSELTGANFTWIASDFIIDNCINCNCHIEVSPNNFGRTLISKHKAELIAVEQKQKEEQLYRNKIKFEIENILKTAPSKNKTITFSILKLIQSLDDPEETTSAPEKILAACKLSPKFFSEAAIDYLSMYFEHKSGKMLIEAVDNINENGVQISQFAFSNLIEAIKDPIKLDATVKIINRIFSDHDLKENISVFEDILNNCDFDDSYGRRHLADITYLNSYKLFSRLFHKNFDIFNDLFQTKLKNENKHSRINCCGFLNGLIEINPDMVIPFIPLLLKSFEFKDDHYGISADSTTRDVLKSIYCNNPKVVIDNIDKLFEKLTSPAKTEIIKFYSKLLHTKLDFDIAEKDVSTIIQKLITLLSKGISDEILKENIFDAIKRISNVRPLSFLTYFDSLLGLLVAAHEDLKKLNWNIIDLQNIDKPAPLTFNPLIGKNYYEIDSLKIRANKVIDISQNIIENIIKEKPNDLFDKVLKIILNLDSKKDSALKASLINILRESLRDTVNISQLLPHVHSFIHDIDSEVIRDAGMKYLVRIIEKHPQIVTKTFIDTVKIFLKDPLVLVRGRSIEAYGAIIHTLPAYVADKELDIIIDCTFDPSVFIHTKATKLSYKLYPFLDEARLNKLTINLVKLEQLYFNEKDFNYCKDLINYLLFITKSRPQIYSNIVNKVLLKHCDTQEYYSELNAIIKLTEIASEFSTYESVWFPNAINFLLRTAPEPFNQGMDERKKLFTKMYEIKPEILTKNIKMLASFTRDRIAKSIFYDVKDAYSILAFFCFYNELKTLTEYFTETIANTASLQYINIFNTQTNVIACNELSAEAENLKIEKLKTANGI